MQMILPRLVVTLQFNSEPAFITASQFGSEPGNGEEREYCNTESRATVDPNIDIFILKILRKPKILYRPV